MMTAEKLALALHKANTGDPHAQLELGRAYANGDGVNVNGLQAIRWLTESAKILTAAKTELGKVYESQKRLSQAEEWYAKAVEDNDGEAMYRLGLLIYKGKLGFRPGKEGVDLLKKAAKKGIKEAQEYIDTYIEDPKSRRFSKISELKSRADLGDVGAQFQLGNIYENGIDVPADTIGAATWYKMASAGGHSISQYRLGMMYLEGRGVPQDKDEAVRYLKMAAALGNGNARGKLNEIAPKHS